MGGIPSPDAGADAGAGPSLTAQLDALSSRVAQLEEQKGRSSRNSSKPPSSDGKGFKSKGSQETSKGTGRKRGAQQGHPGAGRELLPSEQCQEVIHHHPSHCQACGEALAGDDPEPLRHQVVEIAPITSFVIEHQLHRLICPHCQSSTCAALPGGVESGGFGPRLSSLVGLLGGAYHLSHRKVQGLLDQVLGIAISTGAINKIRCRLSEALALAVEEAAAAIRGEPVVHIDETGGPIGNADGNNPGGKLQRLDVVPVRFVQCCAGGHLSDVDWDRFAHGGAPSNCQEDLWLDEAGAGNDFNEIYVRCPKCRKRQALASTKGDNGASLLGQCRGHRPWLGNFSTDALPCTDEKGKPRYNRLLVRSASNAYFPEMVGAISIPEAEDPLRQHLISHLSFFEKVEDESDLKAALKFMPEKVAARLRDLELADVMAVLSAVRGSKGDARSETQPALKLQEIKALYAPSGALGSSDPASTFHAEILPLTGKPSWFTDRFDRVLKVHRLREVMALIGFTRLEPIVKDVDGDPIDHHAIGASRAAINNKELDWVPAIENFGEGLFLGVSEAALQAWRQGDGVVTRSSKHREACKLWNRDHGLKANEFDWPGEAYLMLHSLAHLLITTAALECGYGASAIKERVYRFPGQGYGILLYTSGSGSEGTLGGLVSLADRIDQLVADALERGRLCSNDPFCSLHDPENHLEKRYSHGAACHGCLLIAETSCEQRNQFLDRAFVVPTLDVADAAFFPEQLP